MGRRIALLGASAVIAAVGTALVFLYVRGADSRALNRQEPVRVLVASATIPAGTKVSDAAASGRITSQLVPAAVAAQGAVGDLTPLRDQVALNTIYPGQQILRQLFGPTLTDVTSIPIPQGLAAASFQFTDPARVAGFVEPGSRVAVFLAESERTRLLLKEVSVLAVGPTSLAPREGAAASGEEPSRALLTLALDQAQIEKLILAQQKGQLYLALLNAKSKVEYGAGTGTENLFPR